jgi:diguanylate cyclase (GGDEF)-like protein/PAS domain S-box-containing protein
VSRTAIDPAWHSAFDDLQEAVWVVDSSARSIVFANPSAGRLLGLPREELQGEAVERFAASPQDHLFWADTRQVVADGIESMTVVLRADGELVPVLRRVTPLAMAPGLGAMLVTMLDMSERQHAERELERLLGELRATLDSVADGILVCGLDGRIRAFNHRLVSIWRLPQSLLLRHDDAALHAFLAGRVVAPGPYQERLEQMALDPAAPSRDVLELHGGQIVERRSVPQLSHGSVTGRVYSFRDITEQTQSESALRIAALAFEASPYGIFVADARQVITQVNPRLERLTGYTLAQMLGRPADSLFACGEDDWMGQVQLAWQGDAIWEGELSLPRASGAACAVQLSWVALRDAAGGVGQSLGFVRDLTQHHAARKRIDELAYSDVLTGLPNRLLLSQRVEAALRSARPGGPGFAILVLDLDRFKIINDSLGHAFGDRVLRIVAARLQICLRQTDMLCRLGGDEFAAYVHASDTTTAENVARRMLQEMLQPFSLDAMSFSIQCSIGVALYPQDGASLDELIKQADSAMYRVKERGRGNYGFYQPQMNANLLTRMKLEHAMRQALGKHAMQVHYQPQVEMGTGRIVGVEALLRWTDESMGVVSPATFIPLAEDTGYIVTLGAWVLEQAVMQAASWARSGLSLVMAVNVSALELRQADFVERLAALLQEYALPADCLELELTESMLLQDAQEAAQRLHALAELGVALAIDDFGTGYSSLAYLKNLPIDKLKIDQSFVRGLPGDGGDSAIVSAIVHLGQALKLTVVAEGVETAEQRSSLQTMHCSHFQGFLCAPAMPAAQFEEWLASVQPPALSPFQSM